MPPLLQHGDDSDSSDDNDDNDISIPLPSHNPHCAARGRLPPKYTEFPYITGISFSDPVANLDQATLACIHVNMQATCVDSHLRCIEALNVMHDVDGLANGVRPLAFAAKVNAMDTPTYFQAMNCPNAHLFVKAMEEEMAAMEELKVWEIIDKKDVPTTADGAPCSIIESTWAFKVKHFPDGSVKKHKS
eukprot:12379950-Ditylum_brightwellii.AAC.1